MATVDQTSAWKMLKEHVAAIKQTHLRDLLQDASRNESMTVEADGVFLDYSRQNATAETMDKLFTLAEEAKVPEKMAAIAAGEHYNSTEDRAVMHMALRAPKSKTFTVDGQNVVPDVHDVLERMRDFSARIRSGEFKGATGKALKNVVSIGIGGSFLGPEFVYEALRTDEAGFRASNGRVLRFLANVDPIDVRRCTADLNPEETLVIVVSKTFTTAETMLNARTVRDWLLKGMKGKADESDIVAQHVAACSAAVPKTTEFGIKADNVFGFWDWVGGRYSVCSAVGICPLSIHFGFDIMEKFLAGAASMDEHFLSAPLRQNIPAILGLLGVWNSSFLGHASRALLPYCQALLRFPAHIQQVDMESNGKRVTKSGVELPFEAGEINFGEPGTNGQHSFYQLIHQGRVVPCDFIGFCESQVPIELEDEAVSNHDELMSNFFAQPDALALGKSVDDLKQEGVPEELIPHKLFPGNRPSTSLLFKKLDAYTCGQLLAIYEHRTLVEGAVWDINSFDQWGVELGKVLAKQVRNELSSRRKNGEATKTSFNSSTTNLIHRFLGGK